MINQDQINKALETKGTEEAIKSILDKALQLKGLDIEEAAILLNIDQDNHLDQLYETAKQIKDKIYGNRLVLFAPLYTSNECKNNCLYCGFRKDNTDMKRKTLSIDEVKQEVNLILKQGHKRILMLMGEQDQFDHFLQCIKAAYEVKHNKNEIRRINVEIAPLTEAEFKQLKQSNIGTYTMFQETYHKETYEKMHPSGPKADYGYRLNTMDRAMQAGIDDVGIGALFGLYNFKFETLALLQHAKHLDTKFNCGPHTISIPRLEPAQNAPAAINPPHPVSDSDFKKLVAVLRCSVPYTGMILSTRESPEIRRELFNLGISQISAGSKTSPGGYKEAEKKEQFSLNDTRTTGEIIKDVIKLGYIPSFCTACYRLGRTGQDFMELAKPGLIQNYCQPNALLTLQEYLEEFSDPQTKQAGEELIKKEMLKIPETTRKKFQERLDKIKFGEKDLYF